MTSDAGKARTWILAWIVFSVAGLGLFVAIGCGTGANTCPFTQQKRLETTDGREIYLATCASCHGASASGGRGPNLLAPPVSAYDAETLAAKITRGKPLAGMPAFGKPSLGGRRLTDEQIRAVAAYLISLRAGASPSPTGSAS